MPSSKRRQARGTTGIRPGEKASAYPQLTIRVPPETVRLLTAGRAALERPVWRLVTEATAAYLGDGPALSDAERAAVRTVARARGRIA
jgi:hypothetical protein